MRKRFIYFCLVISIFVSCSGQGEELTSLSPDWEYSLGQASDTVQDAETKVFARLDSAKLGNLESLLEEGVGVIWLRLPVESKVIPDQSVLGVSSGRMAWADETYWNGTLIGSSGSFPPRAWSAWNNIRNYSFPSQLVRNGTNVLLIKLYVENEGFIFGTPLLGKFKDLELYLFPSRFFNSYVNAFVAFLFIIIAIYHYLIYSKRKKDRENYYYALFAIFYAFYCSNFFSDLFYSYLSISYLSFQKLIVLVQTGMVYYLARFFTVFFRMNIPKSVKIGYILTISIPALACLFLSSYGTLHSFRGIITIFQFIPVLIFVIYTIIRGILKNNRQAVAMSYGIIPLAIVVIHDLSLVLFGVQGAVFLAGLGLPLFLGSIMFILATKFVKVQNETDELNENLELKVKERTLEVTQKMEEVQALKIQQDGDYFLTSLIEKPLSTNFNKSKFVSTNIYIDQKKKFSFRKKESDLGGDLCITGNLRFGDGKDRWVVFFNADAMGKSMQGAGGAIVAGTAMNNILSRSARNNRILDISPEEWIENTYLELDSIFKTFNGSMLISCVLGILNEKTGEMIYFNAEHPWTVLYRDGKASFIEDELTLRKLGSESEFPFRPQNFKLSPGDILIAGSDGRDDLNFGKDGDRNLNEDETLFLRLVEESRGSLESLVQLIEFQGELTDDLSLIRIGFQEGVSQTDLTIDLDSGTLEAAQEALRKGKKALAILILDAIWERDRSQLPALKLLIKLCFEEKRYEETVEKINEFHRENRDNPLFWFEKSVCHKQLQQYDAARSSGEICRKFQPDRVANLINLSDSYRMLGEMDEARKILREALQKEPNNPAAIRLGNLLSQA